MDTQSITWFSPSDSNYIQNPITYNHSQTPTQNPQERTSSPSPLSSHNICASTSSGLSQPHTQPNTPTTLSSQFLSQLNHYCLSFLSLHPYISKNPGSIKSCTEQSSNQHWFGGGLILRPSLQPQNTHPRPRSLRDQSSVTPLPKLLFSHHPGFGLLLSK